VNFTEIIQEIYQKVEPIDDHGKLATYIPELANVDASKFGINITTIDNFNFGIGNCNDRFSIQSIAKVLSLSLAYGIVGEDIWKRVDVEPSGTPFNSLLQLEADLGIPRNPFINAGALVIADVLLSTLEHPKEDFLSFVRSISNNASINYSEKIAESEKSVGFRNVALCNFIKSLGNIHNNPIDVLDFYFTLCSLEMSCKELSELFMFLADNKPCVTDYTTITTTHSKRINAIMQTSGFYDQSGEFAFKVGLPGKSGVGGGIIAIHPDRYALAVWSPKLNEKGNSYKGMKFLEEFTTKTQLSIF
jgi:glutaminase